jgi:hypothetical protein
LFGHKSGLKVELNFEFEYLKKQNKKENEKKENGKSLSGPRPSSLAQSPF